MLCDLDLKPVHIMWRRSISGGLRVRKTVVKLHTGLKNLLTICWLKDDVKAWLSVAAVALPAAIAYVELPHFATTGSLFTRLG